ncbi:MAG: transketolase [Candidatus Woesearchaeota archaeon]
MKTTQPTQQQLYAMAQQLRKDSIMLTTTAGSGHPSSCLSCADIMSVLFFDTLQVCPSQPHHPDNDEFVLSKGHAAPILYSALYRAGLIHPTYFDTLRQRKSPLQGHPMPQSIGWVKMATGSLGQGLGVGVGMALAQHPTKKIYVLMGDSECAEGSVYEALQLAGYYKLHNLTCIIDVNRLGQRGQTMLGHDVHTYKKRIEQFGWYAVICDGHHIEALRMALRTHTDKPLCIIAQTLKGKGVSFIENKEGWHGKALSVLEQELAYSELSDSMLSVKNTKQKKKTSDDIVSLHAPKYILKAKKESKTSLRLKAKATYEQATSTRKAYGVALAQYAQQDKRIIALDAETSNSTFSALVKQKTPKQFIESFIAEQNMVSMASGLATQGLLPCVSTFSAFFSRAVDQLRMHALSQLPLVCCGSHAGVSIGEDGASQMGIEDVAIFRSLLHSCVVAPSDALSAHKLLASVLTYTQKQRCIGYMRTCRPDVPLLYPPHETFPIGEFKVFPVAPLHHAVIATHGVLVHTALEIQKILLTQGIAVAVIDCYCIQPFNEEGFAHFVRHQGRKVLIAEDHQKAGGLGEVLTYALREVECKVQHHYVHRIAHSAPMQDCLSLQSLNKQSLLASIHKLV